MLPTLSWRGTLATAAAITASSLGGATSASAAACLFDDSQTGVYFQPGFSCSAGNVTFSNFTYDEGDFAGNLVAEFFQIGPNGSGLRFGIEYCDPSPRSHSITFTVAAAAGLEIVGMDTTAFFEPFNSRRTQTGSFKAEGTNGAVADAALTILPNTPGGAPNPTDSATFDGVDSLSVTITMFTDSMPTRGGAIGFTVADKPDVTPVPEPASLALFGIGLTGLATLQARRRQRRDRHEAVAH